MGFAIMDGPFQRPATPVIPPVPRSPDLQQRLGRDLAAIDALLSRQVNAIIHHPRFQQLEASWQSLRLLVDQANAEEGIKIKLLGISKKELYKDLETAIEFDQSELFRKIYRDAFKMPGGEPFGVLIGDYEFSHHPEDVGLLSKISEVAAVSFCPFIAGAAPTLFGHKSFSALELPRNLGRLFEREDYIEWQRLRDQSESAFIGLTMPRILLRLPYGQGELREEGFDFQEDVAGSEANKYLWGNAAYAFAHVLMRAFAQTGWLAEIRGVVRGQETGGLVNCLPFASFETDRPGLIAKCPTDLTIVDTQEKDLAELGFIPLCHCHGTEHCAFYGCPSLRQPPKFNDPLATMNARISAMLPYVLCASRFAHYLNSLARDQVGGIATPEELETRLNNWVHDYVLDDPNADPELKAEYPLRAAQCQVRDRPGKPGSYDCILRLQPHYQLEAVTANVELKTLRIDQVGDATGVPNSGLISKN
jgi:type VI secretion system ImpC/EvpB family protein